jgi:hypothetical protein
VSILRDITSKIFKSARPAGPRLLAACRTQVSVLVRADK